MDNSEWYERIERLDQLRHKVEWIMRKESERQEKSHDKIKELPEVKIRDKVFYPNRKFSNKAK